MYIMYVRTYIGTLGTLAHYVHTYVLVLFQFPFAIIVLVPVLEP